MKHKRLVCIISSLLLASATAFAGSVSVQQAKTFGEKFVKANFSKTIQLEWVYTSVTMNGNPSFHVFNGSPDGFVIVSACSLTSPILGYSETGTFHVESIPDGLTYFFDGYGQSVDYAEEHLHEADFEIAREWENLERYGQTQVTKTDVVLPMIATHWDQGCYYNASCPKDDYGPCGNAYAGCVATSMAQVMKYWNYPEHGTGTHTYNCPPYGDLFADFGAATYHWEEMPESLSENNLDVSTLIYHCGVSVNMFYNAYGSGALHQSISPALTAYFGYAPSTNLQRDNFTYDQWVDKIHEALDAGTPILYGASSEAGSGHAFILDGYDTNGLIHINWCWGGQLDGYFSVDNFHTGSQQWTLVQKMVADARPAGVYDNMPQAPANFTAQPLSDDSYTCILQWNNPTKTMSNATLTHIDQIVVKRNGSVVYTEDDVTPGAAMEISDEVPESGLYTYQVYAVYNGVQGVAATQTDIRFGTCEPPTDLWFEMTPNNKVKLTWLRPEPNDGLTKFIVYRTKESEMEWEQIKTVSPSSTSSIDNSELEDETFYLYKLEAYYYAIDCYSEPARSKYEETDYVRVYWSVNGLDEYESDRVEVCPNPGINTLNIRTALQNARVEVYDTYGRLIYSQALTENLTMIDATDWAEGVYVWKVYANNKEAGNGKWIKQ